MKSCIPNSGLCSKLVFAIIFLLFAFNLKSQVLPSNFSQVLVANGISNPTVMAFSPDGRIFVAQQGGQLRVIKNGALLATPFVSLSVSSSGERGLLGIAFDPAFSTNNFIYLYYTSPTGPVNKISRFTANGDVAVASSEVTILTLDALSSATNHNGGTMQFGPDGKLYIGVGENANGAHAQNLDTYHGKILRINPDGSVPPGNPFTGGTAQRQRVWAYGLRNPYTITFQPGTGRLFVNDVGQNAWEEINDATTGGLNFGWPGAEGSSTNPAYTNPIYFYGHATQIGQGCAITGGTFFNPAATNYPASYIGKYFFIDYCGNWIDLLTLSGSTATRANFGSSIGGNPVSIVTGNDGNLYFLSRTNSAVYKIVYSGTTAPLITNQPQSITVTQGNQASFSVTATGSAPLTYQWRKNGADISGATGNVYTIATAVEADEGSYSVVVTNAAGSVTSNSATLTVNPPNTKPVGTITAPAVGSTYGGGDVISFSGTGSDAEDGTLGAAAFTWYIDFHHASHTHPAMANLNGVMSGTFTVPVSGETATDVFYRIYLVVRDAAGLSDTTFRNVLPRTSFITLNTNPQGLTVTVDGQPFTAPYTFSSVEGISRSIGTNSPQTLGGITYTYTGWANGNAQTHTLSTPVNDYTNTANFSSPIVTNLGPVEDSYVRSGSGGNNDYGSSTQLLNRNNSVSKGIYFTYLRFNISTLTNVSSVKLRLYGRFDKGNNSTAVGVFNVQNQTWDENLIRYDNRPIEDPNVLATTTVTGTTGRYYEWDVTSHIALLLSQGKTSVSFMLKNTVVTSSFIQFNSKENSANPPQLSVSGSTNRNVEEIPVEQDLPKVEYITVNPNPADYFMELKFLPELTGKVVRLVHVSGRVVKTIRLTGVNRQSVLVDDLKEGVYFLQVADGARRHSQKVLIRRSGE